MKLASKIKKIFSRTIQITPFVVFIFSWPVLADTQVFTAIAKNKDKIVYTEKHQAEFDKEGKIVQATTEYFSPEGKLIATLRSEFTKSLTAPAHEFKDLRYDHQHGIRYEAEKIILFERDKGKPEETKAIDKIPNWDGLVVGCQGLAYYFKDNLEKVKQQKKIPIQFLIPGSLDSYDFELRYLGTDAKGIASLEIEIKSWILRLFAPKLEIKYDEINRRFVTYQGISNLYDENKKQQLVEITYDYQQKNTQP